MAKDSRSYSFGLSIPESKRCVTSAATATLLNNSGLSVLDSLSLFILRRWARTQRAPGYLYQLVEKMGPRFSSRLYQTRIPGGYLMNCNLRDHVQRQIYFFGAYEPVHSFLFTQLLKPGMVVIDAGANVGQCTLLSAASVGEFGSVHAFEPVPGTFALLRAHLESNGFLNVELNQAALWNEETTISLGLPDGDFANLGSYSIGAPEARVTALATSLDDYMERKGLERIDLIKMDIEGAEPYAILGAARGLEKFHPIIMMEIVVTLRRTGSSPSALWKQMRALGYRAWSPATQPRLVFG